MVREFDSIGNIPDSSNYDFIVIPEAIKVAGVFFENRQSAISNLKLDSKIKLIRDPNNSHDKYAIKVVFEYLNEDVQIGWVPKELANVLSQEIDNGIKWFATLGKIIEDETKSIVIKLYYK